jgi:two-component system nitrate/nitrite sensor histidine kinase NarX
MRLIEQISERERAEAELMRSHKGMATLLSASQQLASAIDQDLLPDRILELLEQIVSYSSAAIGTLDDDTMLIRGVRGVTCDKRRLSFDVTDIPLMSVLIDTRAPTAMPDVLSEPSAAALVQAMFGEHIAGRCWLGVPLIATDQVIGMLAILHSEAGYFRPIDQQRVQIFASLAAVAIENARLNEMALAAAVLEERSRIARDLHDAVSQTLFSASLIAEGLRDNRNLTPARQRQGLDDLRQLTRGALAELRALLYELHPGGLAEKPLGQLLDALCTAFTSRTRIPVALAVIGEDHLQPDVQEMLYRIAQETLNNVSKHAAASAARIALTCSPEEVVLVIADDGRGFDMANLSQASLGIGIMRERAAKIGAQLRIESHVGAGTTITVVWRARAPYGAAASVSAQ